MRNEIRMDCGGSARNELFTHLLTFPQAIYIILYGQMQAYTPQLVLNPLKQSPPNKWVEVKNLKSDDGLDDKCSP